MFERGQRCRECGNRGRKDQHSIDHLPLRPCRCRRRLRLGPLPDISGVGVSRRRRAPTTSLDHRHSVHLASATTPCILSQNTLAMSAPNTPPRRPAKRVQSSLAAIDAAGPSSMSTLPATGFKPRDPAIERALQLSTFEVNLHKIIQSALMKLTERRTTPRKTLSAR